MWWSESSSSSNVGLFFLIWSASLPSGRFWHQTENRTVSSNVLIFLSFFAIIKIPWKCVYLTFNQKFVVMGEIVLTFICLCCVVRRDNDWEIGVKHKRLHLTWDGAVLPPLHNTHTDALEYTHTHAQYREMHHQLLILSVKLYFKKI